MKGIVNVAHLNDEEKLDNHHCVGQHLIANEETLLDLHILKYIEIEPGCEFESETYQRGEHEYLH